MEPRRLIQPEGAQQSSRLCMLRNDETNPCRPPCLLSPTKIEILIKPDNGGRVAHYRRLPERPPIKPFLAYPKSPADTRIERTVVLPLNAGSRHGNSNKQPLRLRLAYVVSWIDSPSCKVAVPADQILDFVTPRTLEDYEYMKWLERQEAIESANVALMVAKTAAAKELLLAEKDTARRRRSTRTKAPTKHQRKPKAAKSLVHNPLAGPLASLSSPRSAQVMASAQLLSSPQKRSPPELVDASLQESRSFSGSDTAHLQEVLVVQQRMDAQDSDYDESDKHSLPRKRRRVASGAASAPWSGCTSPQLSQGRVSPDLSVLSIVAPACNPANNAPHPTASPAPLSPSNSHDQLRDAAVVPSGDAFRESGHCSVSPSQDAHMTNYAAPSLLCPLSSTANAADADSADSVSKRTPLVTGFPNLTTGDVSKNDPATVVPPVNMPQHQDIEIIISSLQNEATGPSQPILCQESVEDDDEAWEVDDLEDDKLIDGHWYYLVRWSGDWPPDQNPTWEPFENIPTALIRQYKARKNRILKRRRASESAIKKSKGKANSRKGNTGITLSTRSRSAATRNRNIGLRHAGSPNLVRLREPAEDVNQRASEEPSDNTTARSEVITSPRVPRRSNLKRRSRTATQ